MHRRAFLGKPIKICNQTDLKHFYVSIPFRLSFCRFFFFFWLFVRLFIRDSSHLIFLSLFFILYSTIDYYCLPTFRRNRSPSARRPYIMVVFVRRTYVYVNYNLLDCAQDEIRLPLAVQFGIYIMRIRIRGGGCALRTASCNEPVCRARVYA